MGFLDGGLGDVHGLKTPGKGPVLVEEFAIFLVGCRTDAADFARGEDGFEDVGRIHGPPGGGPCPDEGMDLVDEQNGVLLFLEF